MAQHLVPRLSPFRRLPAQRSRPLNATHILVPPPLAVAHQLFSSHGFMPRLGIGVWCRCHGCGLKLAVLDFLCTFFFPSRCVCQCLSLSISVWSAAAYRNCWSSLTRSLARLISLSLSLSLSLSPHVFLVTAEPCILEDVGVQASVQGIQRLLQPRLAVRSAGAWIAIGSFTNCGFSSFVC